MSIVNFIDPKVIKILRFLALHREDYFLLQMISMGTNVPGASTFRIINKLKKEGIIEIKLMGKLKAYKLKDNRTVRNIIKQLE
jgi:DNA-binding transcriptional ArsR family regulator